MQSKETIADFYHRHGKDYSEAGQFNVYRIEDFNRAASFPHNRRDFYKITLTTKAEGILSYADKVIPINNHALIFSNPLIPYSWGRISGNETGFVCLFTEDFINKQLKTDSVAGSPLFKAGGNPVLFPAPATISFLVNIFEQMLTEIQSSYVNKYELLRSYVQIIIHESLKIAPPDDFYKPGTSAARISSLFLELLERQFPIVSPQHTLHLRNANEFAEQLSVHTNHLNKALRETTGKTTTEHIAEKMIKEAKALLLHSNWTIAEIGYCLGFEHSPNFNIFFKKQTGQTPNHFRKQMNAVS
jgi:AraC family transcriptional activator of pobA